MILDEFLGKPISYWIKLREILIIHGISSLEELDYMLRNSEDLNLFDANAERFEGIFTDPW